MRHQNTNGKNSHCDQDDGHIHRHLVCKHRGQFLSPKMAPSFPLSCVGSLRQLSMAFSSDSEGPHENRTGCRTLNALVGW